MGEELSLRKQQEEVWKLEEQKRMEKVFYDAMIEEAKMRVEREEQLKVAREKKQKLISLYNSEHWKRANANIQGTKRSKKDSSDYKYYWSEEFIESEKRRRRPVGCRRQPDISDGIKHVQPWVEVLKYNNIKQKINIIAPCLLRPRLIIIIIIF